MCSQFEGNLHQNWGISIHLSPYFVLKAWSNKIITKVMHYFTSELLYTVKPRFTGPLGEKELGPVNREARYIGVHFTLIYTQSLFSGDRIEAR